VEVLSGLSIPVALSEVVREPISGEVMVVVADLPHGFSVPDKNMLVITETEFLEQRRATSPQVPAGWLNVEELRSTRLL